MLLLLVFTFYKVTTAELSVTDVQYLNELPLDKLLQLKTSLQDLATSYDNVTTTPAFSYPSFGPQALALNAPPVKRGDYEAVYKKESKSKLGNLFTMSITTLAFLAFGGYLLCLIVQAVKAKESQVTTTPPAFFLSGIKKKPHFSSSSQVTSYGRRRRALQTYQLEMPPEQLFDAMLQLCEGYARWSQENSDGKNL